VKGTKFAYAVTKNLYTLLGEAKAIDAMLNPDKEYQKYEEKRVELATKHSKKDENSHPVVEGGQYVLENEEEFNKEFDVLKEEFKETLVARDAQIKEYNEQLSTDSDVVIHKVKLEDVAEGISLSVMGKIHEMIIE
jgi:hypothetical protein